MQQPPRRLPRTILTAGPFPDPGCRPPASSSNSQSNHIPWRSSRTTSYNSAPTSSAAACSSSRGPRAAMTTPARSRMPLTDTSNQPGRCRGPISDCSAANDGDPASAGKSPTPRRVAPGRPEARLLDLALLLILRPRETGDMRTMVKEHARHNGPSHDGRASLRPPAGGNRARSGQEGASAAAIAGHGSGHQSRSSTPPAGLHPVAAQVYTRYMPGTSGVYRRPMTATSLDSRPRPGRPGK